MKIWLAPLHGITYSSFRNLFYQYFAGVDCAITPFFPVQETKVVNVKKWTDLYPSNNTLFEVIPQLMGNKPNDFVDTIHALQDSFGYERFNWNIGCPAQQIVRKKRGCGIMPFAEDVERVVDSVLSNCQCRFSLKMRLGLYDPQESLSIINKVNKFPLDFIVVHPRLGIDNYNGVVDLNAFKSILESSANTIIYSGDIVNYQNYKYLHDTFPTVSDWMIGRGLLQNPFLASEIKQGIPYNYGLEERVRFADFYQELYEIYKKEKGEKRTLAQFKEFWRYFSFFTPIAEEKMRQMLRLINLSEFYDESYSILASSFNPANG